MPENAPKSVSIFKNFPGVTPPDPLFSEGTQRGSYTDGVSRISLPKIWQPYIDDEANDVSIQELNVLHT